MIVFLVGEKPGHILGAVLVDRYVSALQGNNSVLAQDAEHPV